MMAENSIRRSPSGEPECAYNCQNQCIKRLYVAWTPPRNGGLPGRPTRLPRLPSGRMTALALRPATGTPRATGGMPAPSSYALSFASRTCPPAAPSRSWPRRARRATISPGAVRHPAARRVSSRQGSLHEARGGAGGARRRAGRAGARAAARRPSARCASGGISSEDGQDEDEDKGVNRGGGHATGRVRAHGVLTMGQGGRASA